MAKHYKILLLSQVYWPDNVAVSLFTTDLAEALANCGHSVTVWSGQYPWEADGTKYKRSEKKNGVHIKRLRNTQFGKSNVLFRLLDFLSFNFLIFFRLLFLKRKHYDLVIGGTVPPMLSFIGTLFIRRKRYKYFTWIMDLQPELAIQSGLIREGSVSSKFLTFLGDRVFKRSHHLLVLDHFMKKHVMRRGNRSETEISITPLWPIMTSFYDGGRLDNPFRKKYGLGNKKVIMYSGNHSFVHPLSTILNAAKLLRDREDLLFVFIGEGVRKKEVAEFRKEHNLQNIIQLPFQAREETHLSLGAADLQVVVLGDGQVGYTHPNKIYGALFVAKPVLYVGPQPSHVSEVLDEIDAKNISVAHGSDQELAKKLSELCDNEEGMKKTGAANRRYALEKLSAELLKSRLCDQIETQLHESIHNRN